MHFKMGSKSFLQVFALLGTIFLGQLKESHCDCLETSRSFGGTPVPGETDGTNQFPYVVSLTHNGLHTCGGVLISPRHVLTAAQCIQTLHLFLRMEVHIGGIKLNEPKERRSPANVIYHPKWNGDRRYGNDLAIIELNEPSKMSPVQLPKKRMKILSGDLVTGLGWGRTSSNSGFPALMQEVHLDFTRRRKCGELGVLNGSVKRGMMCLGGNGSGFCDGEEGAPIIKRGACVDVLVGIGSFQEARCGTIGKPGISSRLDLYLQWLRKATR